ncbi:replication initiation protein [Buttiauxella sp. 3AFRM03]|nr:replication initiation protein [Buttiauxella sp. 3AFRM03]
MNFKPRNYRLESNPERHVKTPLVATIGNLGYTRDVFRGLEVVA